MRATRSIVASLGAGVTLAIAASACLLVVSAVVAFRGWPGQLSTAPNGVTELLAASAPFGGQDAAARAAAPAGDALRLALASAPSSRRSTGARRPARPVTLLGASPQAGTPFVPFAVATGLSGPAATGTRSPGAAEIVRGTTAAASKSIRDAGTAGGSAVAPAAPAAGSAVTGAAGTAASAVDATGRTAGAVVDGALSRP